MWGDALGPRRWSSKAEGGARLCRATHGRLSVTPGPPMTFCAERSPGSRPRNGAAPSGYKTYYKTLPTQNEKLRNLEASKHASRQNFYGKTEKNVLFQVVFCQLSSLLLFLRSTLLPGSLRTVALDAATSASAVPSAHLRQSDMGPSPFFRGPSLFFGPSLPTVLTD